MKIRRHLKYLEYLIKHKWFVFLACLKINPVKLLLVALIHDLSKLLPSEWFPYSNTFYAPDGSKQYNETPEFAIAWNHHQKRNKHHWQYWLIMWDRGELNALPIPEYYVYEMVADWMGAGRAITGKWETLLWYEKNKDKIILHPTTREKVETILKEGKK